MWATPFALVHGAWLWREKKQHSIGNECVRYSNGAKFVTFMRRIELW